MNSLDEWTNVGGAIDMKVYSMEDAPLDLAVKNDVHKPGIALTSVIVENLDKVRLDQSQHSGLHQLAAVAELQQQQQAKSFYIKKSHVSFNS